MGNPTKSFISIMEASARWERPLNQIVGWAAAGKIKLVTGITFARAEERCIAGLVEINGADLYPTIRVDTPALQSIRIYRIRPLEGGDGEGWVFVSDQTGECGVDITTQDVCIAIDDFIKFQDENGLAPVREKIVYRGGAGDKHDWEAMYVKLCKRIFEMGVPETLRELTREMQQFFIDRSEDGEAPDESTIRKRLQPIWNELRESA